MGCPISGTARPRNPSSGESAPTASMSRSETSRDVSVTLYVIDHKGVIRHKWLGSPGDKVLDDAIEKLVAEAEKGGKPEK